MEKLCSIDGCESTTYQCGWCTKHYQRIRHHGDPHYTGRRTPEQRFWAKVDKSGDCWLWTRATTPAGYGVMNIDQQTVYVHRYSFELANGPLTPDRSYVDHICHNPACVRPTHLRAVTNKQNGENHQGLIASNKSGVRGVWWNKHRSKWTATVTHHQRQYHAGSFDDITKAEAAVIELRNKLFTHNDIDRVA